MAELKSLIADLTNGNLKSNPELLAVLEEINDLNITDIKKDQVAEMIHRILNGGMLDKRISLGYAQTEEQRHAQDLYTRIFHSFNWQPAENSATEMYVAV